MDFSKLSYEQIKSTAEELNSASEQMETVLNEIKTLFNKIGTEEVWSGQAALASKESFDKLSAKFPEFALAIKDCYKYLLIVVENFQNVDASVQKAQQ